MQRTVPEDVDVVILAKQGLVSTPLGGWVFVRDTPQGLRVPLDPGQETFGKILGFISIASDEFFPLPRLVLLVSEGQGL